VDHPPLVDPRRGAVQASHIAYETDSVRAGGQCRSDSSPRTRAWRSPQPNVPLERARAPVTAGAGSPRSFGQTLARSRRWVPSNHRLDELPSNRHSPEGVSSPTPPPT
jgi:hypothetical protein